MKSLTQQQISKICEDLLDRLPDLLTHMGVDFIEYPNIIAFPCPVHGGDNPEACCIFTDGNSAKGNWHCWTRHCEEDFTGSLVGLVRGWLEKNGSEENSFQRALEFCCDFLKIDVNKVKESAYDKGKVSQVFKIFNEENLNDSTPVISRESIRQKLDVPSLYYLNNKDERKRFSTEALDVFDIGDCKDSKQAMYGRVVVPIYDERGNYSGCVGRTKSEVSKSNPKWKNSKGFSKSANLYGFNVTAEHILSSGVAIIVEGQSDVWRLYEAGLPMAVGIFGSSLSEKQLITLEKSGAFNLVVLTDYDEAGITAYKGIVDKCGRRFNYIRPDLTNWFKSTNLPQSEWDVGNMTIQEIKNKIYPLLKGIINDEHYSVCG
jgi:5S rRNA maturation endonuclease (ribonuclease M5)